MCSDFVRHIVSAVFFISILFLYQTALCKSVEGVDDGFIQLHGLIDIRSTFSDGFHDFDYLVNLAQERGFDVIFIHDHDRMTMEYGLFPLRNIIRKRVEKPAVNVSGAQNYLKAFSEVQEKFPGILVMEGIESAPHYYWSGSLFSDEGLSANDWERHLLVMGLNSADAIETLPDIHNNYSNSFGKKNIVVFSLFCATALIGIVIWYWGGFFKVIGFIFVVFGAALALDNSPLFNTPPFDQYQGPQGTAPYQALIDDVNNKGGLTFWNHMETLSGVRDLGPIKVSTPSYPEMLVLTKDYTGFASIYGDNIYITEPGREWDQLLLDYCNGGRKRPIWGISTADYHEEAKQGTGMLGHYQTVFWVKERSKDSVLQAMKNGKMYASQGPYFKRPILDYFSVSDSKTNNQAISGDEISVTGNVNVSFAIHTRDSGSYKIKIRIVRAGEVIKVYNETTPFRVKFEDTLPINRKTFYRIDAKGPMGQIVSNPIFVEKL